jgi:predicted ester cyclase
MTEAEALVRALFAESVNAHDADASERFCGDDYRWHGVGASTTGLPAFKSALAGFFVAFPDVHAEILDVVAAGDRAAVRYREAGTHRGEFMGVPPTGVSAAWHGIAIYRADRGKLVEEWSVMDTLSLLQQLTRAAVDTPPPDLE